MNLLTITGRAIDLSLDVETLSGSIVIEDIAGSLSNLCRFNGHTREFYSVAQHSVSVSRLCPPPLRLAGLLHDAHEAYVGDTSRPVLVVLHKVGQVDGLRMLRQTFDAAIGRRFGFNPDDFRHQAVRTADDVMMATEFRDLFPSRDTTEGFGIEMVPRAQPVSPCDPAMARRLFLEEFKRIVGGQHKPG